MTRKGGERMTTPTAMPTLLLPFLKGVSSKVLIQRRNCERYLPRVVDSVAMDTQ